MPTRIIAFFQFVLLLCASTCYADIRLPQFFGDHMVLQQEMPIRIWGWADPGEAVTVSFANSASKTVADDDGRWHVTLAATQANKAPAQMVISGRNTIELKDILVGEVWLCSGQSNMEWTVARSSNAKQEIETGKHPLIRHFKVPRLQSTVPKNDIASQWQTCSPETVGNFTACGYFMARALQAELDVPIGLINSSWGGTRVEPWTPLIGFQKTASLRETYNVASLRTPGTPQHTRVLGDYLSQAEKWLSENQTAVGQGRSLTPLANMPDSLLPYKNRQDPTMLYNGMIHPLVGYTIRGAIWYQGEANRADGMAYLDKKRALIGGWRELWGQGDFPFYYVQIAPYQYGKEPATVLPRFWEAQAAVQDEVINTAMVVTNDIATVKNIHPPNKQDVGLRLANLALKNQYGKERIASSPTLSKLDIDTENGLLKLTFKDTGGGLKTRDGKAPSHFEIIGNGSGGFQSASATINGDVLSLSSDKVAQPVAFRFAWNKLAEPNLMGASGLPVAACRGGQEPDLLSQLSLQDFQLVYELDLTNLNRQIQYSVDRSHEVKSFTQVGYLVELTSGGEKESVFVAMDAFSKDVKKIGVPTAISQARFQQPVKNMSVYSTADGVQQGTDLVGNIEFWPNNYGQFNAANVSGANSSKYDFGDQPAPPVDGYGCMQVHHPAAKQTVFAINHWNAGKNADVGIGNASGPNPDWTFTGSAKTYSEARLRVYVK